MGVPNAARPLNFTLEEVHDGGQFLAGTQLGTWRSPSGSRHQRMTAWTGKVTGTVRGAMTHPAHDLVVAAVWALMTWPWTVRLKPASRGSRARLT
jgi:hypothetical protein